MDQTYEDAVAEVLDILNHTKIEDVKKIPPKVITHLQQHSSKTYIPNLDHTKKLKDMNLKPKTKALICLIYREYFCDEKQRKEYDKRIIKSKIDYQKDLQTKYDTNNLFTNKLSKKQKTMQETTLVKNKEKSFYKKILNMFKLTKRNGEKK